ncbi:MAG: preprotein translocase subunit YajC [Pseudomonadota bacterium]
MFISNAFAQAAAPAANGGLMGNLGTFAIPLLMFVVMYFLMIKPQQKKAKEQAELMAGLVKGDEVVTAGGLLGKVVSVKDTYVTIEISANTEVVVQKHAITTVLPKGTLKSL